MTATIVIPGIKGTELVNTYPVGHDTLWSPVELLHEDPSRLALEATASIESDPRVVGRERRLFGVVYGELVGALRSRFADPVYLFPYDWRRSVVDAGKQLADFVGALRHKPGLGPSARFNFVCHSMGGLVFRAFARQKKMQQAVDRVVFVATPHEGALDAVEALIRGETNLLHGQKKMRKAARTFPAVYELLPRYHRAVVRADDPSKEHSIWDPDGWQSDKEGSHADRISRDHLEASSTLEERLLPVADLARYFEGRVLSIYGGGERTLRTVPVRLAQGSVTNWFDFAHAWTGDGDSVVLVDSAEPPGIPSIEMQADDVRWLGVADRALAETNLHAFLPVIDEVQTIVGRFLSGTSGAALLPLGLPGDRYHA